MKSHRDTYPTHRLVGRRVRVNSNLEGVVQRVFGTQWGTLVDLGTSDDEGNPLAYGIWTVKEIEDV